MPRLISFSNRKGGSGKTTTTVNVSTALALKGFKILVIDTDPQAHTTLSFGITVKDINTDLSSILIDNKTPEDCTVNTFLGNLKLIPATKRLMEFERNYSKIKEARTLLSERISSIIGSYDYIILDTPPTLSLLTVSTLITVNEVYIPMQTHFLAMEGLAEMVRLIYKINRLYNPNLRLRGIIPTFYKERTRLARNIIDEIKKNLGENIIMHPIRINIALAEAPGYGQPVFQYQLKSHGAYDYYRLAEQIEKGLQ